MQKYFISDKLQSYINWDKLMKMNRSAGGHDEQMRGLFKNSELIAHWNEGDYQGKVATCVKLNKGVFKGKFVAYIDYYGSCSGCDSWEDASDDEAKNMLINLSNGAHIFESLKDVLDFLENDKNTDKFWRRWDGYGLLEEIEKYLQISG